MRSYWQDLAWDCNHHFSHICTSVMALDFCQNFVPVQYLENKWTWFHQILYNNICIHIDKNYVGIVTHHFLHICTLQSYGPWFTPVLFLFNFLRTKGQNFTKFYILFILTRSMLGLLAVIFANLVRVMSLDWCQNYVTTQYPEKLWPLSACKALQRGYSQILWQF